MWENHTPSGKRSFAARLAVAAVVVGAFATAGVGCASENAAAKPARATQNQCVPNQVLRCLCELDEGFQVCTEDGVLPACECGSSTLPAPRDATPDRPFRPDAGGQSDTGPEPRCGDDFVDPGEACDDGNNIDDDGCSSTCIPDGHPVSGGGCPGQPVTLWPARITPSVHIVGTTAGYANSSKSSCYDSKGSDRVYAITPMKDGVMSVRANFGENFSAVVSLHKTCSETLTTASKLFCSDTLGFPLTQLVEVKQGSTNYLVIDGDVASTKGPFELDLSLQ